MSSITGKPQAWLWTGDAIYPRQRGVADLDVMERDYIEFTQWEAYRKFSADLPMMFGTWDDHDYGGNDYGINMPQKEERAKLFWKYILQKVPPKGREGVYHSVTWGQPPHQLQAIVLDTRYFRQDHCIPSVAAWKWLPLGSGIACLARWFTAGIYHPLCSKDTNTDAVLGRTQWDWLTRQIQTSQASLIVVVSSIQVLTTNPVMESWGHFPPERDRLLRLLTGGKQPTVLLSGDVHHAEILEPTTRLLEVTSSGLTHDCSGAVYGRLCKPLLESFASHRRQPSDYYIGRNFGSLAIDWEQGDWEVRVHDINGTRVLSTGSRSLDDDSSNTSEVLDLEQIPQVWDGHLQPHVAALLIGLVTLVMVVRIIKR